MLKRISKEQIQLGMFVEDVEGAWQDNPINTRRFKLESATQVDAIRRSQLTAVIINTALGLDVAAAARPKPTPSRTEKERVAAVSGMISETEGAVEDLFTKVRQNEAPDIADYTPVMSQILTVMNEEPYVFRVVSRLKTKDNTTFLHSVAVSALMAQFGAHLKLGEEMVRTLAMGGLLHDIGKMKIPEEILTKEGKLTEEEFALIRDHPTLGHDILSRSADVSPVILDVCLNHHEQLSGGGYPRGLRSEEISLPARIAAICDVYEAITSVRPYKTAWSTPDALAWMMDRKGHFDRSLLAEFIASIEKSARRSKLRA